MPDDPALMRQVESWRRSWSVRFFDWRYSPSCDSTARQVATNGAFFVQTSDQGDFLGWTREAAIAQGQGQGSVEDRGVLLGRAEVEPAGRHRQRHARGLDGSLDYPAGPRPGTGGRSPRTADRRGRGAGWPLRTPGRRPFSGAPGLASFRSASTWRMPEDSTLASISADDRGQGTVGLRSFGQDQRLADGTIEVEGIDPCQPRLGPRGARRGSRRGDQLIQARRPVAIEPPGVGDRRLGLVQRLAELARPLGAVDRGHELGEDLVPDRSGPSNRST